MNSVKNASKFLVALAALGLGLAGCEQRGADTSGASGSQEAADGAMNPPGTAGQSEAGTQGGAGSGAGTGY